MKFFDVNYNLAIFEITGILMMHKGEFMCGRFNKAAFYASGIYHTIFSPTKCTLLYTDVLLYITIS
jgi:hypothetical protein